jgi:hypothetical protein
MICKAECLIVWEKTGFEFSIDVLSYKLTELESIFDDIIIDIINLGYVPEPINLSDYNNMLYYYYVDMDSNKLPNNIAHIVQYVKQMERNVILEKLL